MLGDPTRLASSDRRLSLTGHLPEFARTSKTQHNSIVEDRMSAGDPPEVHANAPNSFRFAQQKPPARVSFTPTTTPAWAASSRCKESREGRFYDTRPGDFLASKFTRPRRAINRNQQFYLGSFGMKENGEKELGEKRRGRRRILQQFHSQELRNQLE